MCNKIILISAFFDIGRENFKNSSRSVETYLNSFKNYYMYNYDMIVFIDDKYSNEFINLDPNKIIIPINREWLIKNLKSWQQLDQVINIMNSDSYKELVQNRITNGNPENIYPEYNVINHSKIDFIKYAIDNNLVNSNNFICWSDFGYFNSILHNNPSEFPQFELDLEKFNKNKLNFFLRNQINEEDSDIIYTLLNAPEIFTGCFWGGSIENLEILYHLYHECLDELYNMNVSDDDQHIYLRCYLKNPEIFNLTINSEKWFQVLLDFQLNFSDRLQFINFYSNQFINGKFAEIGVCYGVLSENILDNNNSCNLYCVDPYINYIDYEDSCNEIVGDELFNSVNTKLKNKFGERVNFIRSFSVEASLTIDNDFDLIYIDGNHKYLYVLDDLRAWYPKLKKGGILLLDDVVDELNMDRDENGDVFIKWNQWSSGKYGVLLALKKFTEELNIKFYRWKNQAFIRK